MFTASSPRFRSSRSPSGSSLVVSVAFVVTIWSRRWRACKVTSESRRKPCWNRPPAAIPARFVLKKSF